MITLHNVSKFYNKNKILQGINLRIEPGEFVSIVGQSGAGKTTMVKLLIGEEKVGAGQVVIGDWDITKISKKEIPTLYNERRLGSKTETSCPFLNWSLIKLRTASTILESV